MKTQQEVWELELVNEILKDIFNCGLSDENCLRFLLDMIDNNIIPGICYSCGKVYYTEILRNKTPCIICSGEILLANYLLFNEDKVDLKVIK